jgi:hypothetical protein
VGNLLVNLKPEDQKKKREREREDVEKSGIYRNITRVHLRSKKAFKGKKSLKELKRRGQTCGSDLSQTQEEPEAAEFLQGKAERRS